MDDLKPKWKSIKKNTKKLPEVNNMNQNNYFVLFISLLLLNSFSFSFASPNSEELIEAIESENISMVESLVRYGVDPNEGVAMYNTTPLMYAVEVGSVKVVHKLLEHGSDVDAVDHFGNTPLIQSINANQNDIASLLIINSRNINTKTGQGTTALHVAAKQGNEDLFKKILQKGGDLKAHDYSGNNTLFYAIAGRNRNMINKLIAMNYFDLSHTNTSGENFIKVAQRYGLKDVAQSISRGRN